MKEKSEYITISSYGARWVKITKDNVSCLNKPEKTDAVAYFLFNC